MQAGPHKKRARKDQREADHSRLVDGNKQGNLHPRLILGGCRASRSQHLTTRILTAYRETSMGFSHYPVQVVSTPPSLKDASLEELPLWEQWAECKFQGQGRGWGPSDCPGPVCGSTHGHVLSMTSSDIIFHICGIASAQRLLEGVLEVVSTLFSFNKHIVDPSKVPSSGFATLTTNKSNSQAPMRWSPEMFQELCLVLSMHCPFSSNSPINLSLFTDEKIIP